VLAGLVFFAINFRRYTVPDRFINYSLLVFTILFPVIFVIAEDSNLYSSWRQFLFLYPGIVIISASGFSGIINNSARKYQKLLIFLVLAFLLIHPLRFMIKEHPYEYLYYNEFAGGLKGAHGSYETDYYYTAQTEASEWLIGRLRSEGIDSAIVKATYSVDWQFRKEKGIESSYFRYEERSMSDWDYAIVTNRYIPPFRLKGGLWPPDNTIHTVWADSVPLCAVLERKDKSDYRAYLALEKGDNELAIELFNAALSKDDTDEMIFYNFARALYNTGRYALADSVLKEGLKINPGFEPILMYLGNIASVRGETELAEAYYEKLIAVNRKYFDAYVILAQLRIKKDLRSARVLLRSCLTINPAYVPAIKALADTYMETDPSVAEKYYELAESLTNK
jgi:tetratricopeptide (TPR) repeat protein